MYVLHTAMVYLCALTCFPWLVSRWFAWVEPFVHISESTSGTDWYLHHLATVNLALALAVGYGMARGARAAAIWAWSVPTLLLIVKMMQFANRSSTGSVLYTGTPTMSAIEYFFGILPRIPSAGISSAVDYERVWAQLTTTASFCAGIGYALGALVARYELLTKMFIFEKHEDIDSRAEPMESREMKT
jgi:hypothetical protein